MKRRKIPAMVCMNLAGRLMQSVTMVLLAALMSASCFAGMILVPAAREGMETIQRRLGADIMVVPYAALSKKSFENEILSGSTVPVYMSGENSERISQIEGVSAVSSQICLGDVYTDLSDDPVHLMGYDPATDFCITPWIGKSARIPEGTSETAVVGSRVRAEAGDVKELLSASVFVAGKMEETGTELDTSIYIESDALLRLAAASSDAELRDHAAQAEGNRVSAVLVDVADGYDPEPVLNSINIHIRKIRAIVSEQVIQREASSIHGVSSSILFLTVAAGCAAMAAYSVVYILVTMERKREFALLRTQGASRRMLSAIVMSEGAVISLAGGVVSIVIMLVSLPALLSAAGNVMKLSLPFPGAVRVLLCAVTSVCITFFAGMSGSVIMARLTGRLDAASLLRES